MYDWYFMLSLFQFTRKGSSIQSLKNYNISVANKMTKICVKCQLYNKSTKINAFERIVCLCCRNHTLKILFYLCWYFTLIFDHPTVTLNLGLWFHEGGMIVYIKLIYSFKREQLRLLYSWIRWCIFVILILGSQFFLFYDICSILSYATMNKKRCKNIDVMFK